jgi:hypothetical protein
VRRCDELRVTRKQADDRQPWIDVLKTVKQQRVARASAQDFDLDAGDRNELRGRRGGDRGHSAFLAVTHRRSHGKTGRNARSAIV